jgi:adenylosuccinate lyase
VTRNDLAARLAEDGRLRLSLEQISGVIDNAAALTGLADQQVSQFIADTDTWSTLHPDASAYHPASIL